MQKYYAKKSLSLNPVGVTGKGGAGGAIFISVQDNVTHAIVQDGASVYSGLDGGFNMKAEEAILNVNLAQSWANGKSFAIGGTVLYSGQTSDTLAQLGAAATVTGRDARLYAGDLTTNVTWAGGIAKGEALGVGISVAINDLDRKTRALIGAADATPARPCRAAQRIDVAEGVSTLARVDGDIWAFTVAGAVAKAASDVPARPPQSRRRPALPRGRPFRACRRQRVPRPTRPRRASPSRRRRRSTSSRTTSSPPSPTPAGSRPASFRWTP
jgi:hypothetical protein